MDCVKVFLMRWSDRVDICRAPATDKALGKPYTVKFLLDAQVKEGKVVKTYLHFDRLSVFNQLGIAPPAPTAKK